MRIVLTHPYCWPYVRRGAERFIAEFARYLTRRGHEVITVSSKPGRPVVEQTLDGLRILHGQMWTPTRLAARLTPTHTFLLGLLRSLSSLRADFVHSLAYLDACVANWFRSRTRHRTVYQVIGPPVPHWFPRIPPDRFLLRKAILESDRCIVHSAFTARIVRQYYGINAQIIPVPIDLTQFPLKAGPRPRRPVLLGVASFDDRRKGLRVLVEAFALVKRRIPEVVLRLSGKLSPGVQAALLDPLPAPLRAHIEVLGVGQLVDVPRWYREASLTVLPAMWEAYGMAVVESWASGTPTVVTRHGGLGELVHDSPLGRAFDPLTDGQETRNAEGLAEAILAALPLAENPATRYACRARAEQYTWEVLGPAYEALYTGN